MIQRAVGKTLGFVGYTIQYGCIAHCAFEYIGELVMVPKGHVWLGGDDLKNSTDSRSYGPVPYTLITGRVCFKLWPLEKCGSLQESPNGRILQDD
ncbi:UNVERIFIED_CONTAM: hypothetical protein FKN15_005612 [Acipenser sinensis]